jgi:hypothetical protein
MDFGVMCRVAKFILGEEIKMDTFLLIPVFHNSTIPVFRLGGIKTSVVN